MKIYFNFGRQRGRCLLCISVMIEAVDEPLRVDERKENETSTDRHARQTIETPTGPLEFRKQTTAEIERRSARKEVEESTRLKGSFRISQPSDNGDLLLLQTQTSVSN